MPAKAGATQSDNKPQKLFKSSSVKNVQSKVRAYKEKEKEPEYGPDNPPPAPPVPKGPVKLRCNKCHNIFLLSFLKNYAIYKADPVY